MGNSVIYRPAYDAEVEYLESTGTQYIDTGIVPTENTRVVAKLYTEQDVNTNLFGSQVFVANNYEGYALNYDINGVIDYIFGNSGWRTVSASYSLLNRVFEIDYSNVALKVDEVTLTTSLCSEFPTLTKSMLIFWRTGTSESSKTAGRVYYFKIYSGSTLVRDFIPIRIGQVGYLYDKVSKQLFANKGTGNFILGNDVVNAVIPQQRCVLYFGNQRSVIYERIYEEYEWLVGDGEAYTRIPINPYREVFLCKFLPHNTDGFSYIWLINIVQATQEMRCFVDQHNKITIRYGSKEGNVPQLIYEPFTEIEWTTSIRVTQDNEVELTKNGVVTTHNVLINNNLDSSFPLKIYAYGANVNSVSTDNHNLIPCKLLQPIPAILDGNGIARQAGECGMWDKVSNRFYGNVASSGTFTVKGPKCYEEYEWLVAEIPPQSVLMTIGIGNVFNYSRVYESIGNSSHLLTDGYNYYTSSTAMVSIGVWNGSQNVENKAVNFTNGLSVVCTQDKLTFNSVEFPKYGLPARLRWNNSANTGGTDTVVKTSSVTVDGSVRYVPCKLTHGIPASMDANGIPRPSGTCGMWDKVNDKFYGNVANSGTFTVSND